MRSNSKQAAKPRVVAGVRSGQTLQQAARSAGVSPSTVAKWRKRDSGFDQRIVAAMQDTPRADFAATMVGAVRLGIASTTEDVLLAAALAGAVSRSDEELEAIEDPEEIRSNLDLTYVDLSHLAGNESAEIKQAVAGHPNTSGATLHFLATSEKSTSAVIQSVLDNPNMLDETYEDMLRDGRWELLLAQSEHTPPDMLERLTHSYYLPTRNAALAALGRPVEPERKPWNVFDVLESQTAAN